MKFIKLNLESCPFCGKEIEYYSIETNKYGVTKLKIKCCMDFSIESDEVLIAFSHLGETAVKIGKDAIEKWNTRVGE